MLCLSAMICMMFVNKYVGSVYVCLSESRLCVFRELCSGNFLIVGESPSVLLESVVMSYVNCGDDGSVV